MAGWVGRGQGAGLPLGSVHVSFLGSWVGWVGRGDGAGFSLGSLHVSFLGSWVGWVGRGQEAGLSLGSLHFRAAGSDGWPRAGLPFGLPSCFLSRLWGRMGGPRPRISAHVSFFLGSSRPRSSL